MSLFLLKRPLKDKLFSLLALRVSLLPLIVTSLNVILNLAGSHENVTSTCIKSSGGLIERSVSILRICYWIFLHKISRSSSAPNKSASLWQKRGSVKIFVQSQQSSVRRHNMLPDSHNHQHSTMLRGCAQRGARDRERQCRMGLRHQCVLVSCFSSEGCFRPFHLDGALSCCLVHNIDHFIRLRVVSVGF